MKVRKLITAILLLGLSITSAVAKDEPKKIVKSVNIEWVDSTVGGHVNIDTVNCYEGEDCDAKVTDRIETIEKLGGRVIS